MTKKLLGLFFLLGSIASADNVWYKPTATPQPSPTVINTATPAPTTTAQTSPTIAPSPTDHVWATMTPVPTATVQPSPTLATSPTAVNTATPIPAPTVMPSPAAFIISFTSTTNAVCSASTGTTIFFGINNIINSTETLVARFISPISGDLKSISVKVSANVPASETATIKVSVNASTTSTLTCSIAAGASTCSSSSTTKAIIAGDLVSISFNCAGSTTAITQPIQIGLVLQ